MLEVEKLESLIIGILGAGIGSGCMSILQAYLNRKWQKQDRHDARVDALVNAQMVTMIDRVRYLSKAYIKQGCITLEDKENLQEMYKAYKSLGGNGHLETAMAEVDKIKVASEECS